MNASDYLVQSGITASPQFHPDRVNSSVYNNLVAEFSILGRAFDSLKKTLFYGRPGFEVDPDMLTLDRTNVHPVEFVHGIIGSATEVAELVDMLLHREIDLTHLEEEIGDVLWYLAMLLRWMGSNFETAMEKNIRKLRIRYPDKFDPERENVRNLFEERRALES